MNILEYSSGQYQQAISRNSKLLKHSSSQKLEISRNSKLYFPAGMSPHNILKIRVSTWQCWCGNSENQLRIASKFD